jgi:hypothetical protein
MKNIPDKIYLNIGEDLDAIEDFGTLREVTWCQDRIHDGDIEYIRAPESSAYLDEEAETIINYAPDGSGFSLEKKK